jgi:putative two-component system response regulator
VSTNQRILIVDDEDLIRELLSRWFADEGYEVALAASAEEALEALNPDPPELLILDITLPGMSGIELLETVKREHGEKVAAVMVTGVDDRTTAVRCLELGAHSYVVKPIDQRDLSLNVAAALKGREQAIIARDYQKFLEIEVRRRTEETRRREEEIALRLVAAAEHGEPGSRAHVRRIGMFSEVLARALGWGMQAIDDIRVAASMHDIGKIGVPTDLLQHADTLSPSDLEVLKRHAELGAEMLTRSDIPLIQMAEKIARSHHEWWDGSGYPDGLAGEAIPLAARIVAIADAYDTLTHPRPSRPAFSEEEAFDMMGKGRGKQFDPIVFDVLTESLPVFRRITEGVADEAT